MLSAPRWWWRAGLGVPIVACYVWCGQMADHDTLVSVARLAWRGIALQRLGRCVILSWDRPGVGDSTCIDAQRDRASSDCLLRLLWRSDEPALDTSSNFVNGFWVESRYYVVISRWFFVVLASFAWLPLALGVLHVARLRRRQARGECATCGYSLRGLNRPRCPECGTAFDPRAAQAPVDA